MRSIPGSPDGDGAAICLQCPLMGGGIDTRSHTPIRRECLFRSRPAETLAIRIACGVAWRLPTIAAEDVCNNSALPRKNKTGGAVIPCVSISGKSSSCSSNRRQPSCISHFKAASADCCAKARLSALRHDSTACLWRTNAAIVSAGAFKAACALPNCCNSTKNFLRRYRA